MKKVLTCFLIIIVSFVNSYETIKHFSKSFADSSLVDNFQCEEKSDTEKSGDEKNFSDDFYLTNNSVSYFVIELKNLGSIHANHFPSSDYYQEIYSPPEFL